MNANLSPVRQWSNPLAYEVMHEIYKVNGGDLPIIDSFFLLPSIDIGLVESNLEALTKEERTRFITSGYWLECGTVLIEFRAAILRWIANPNTHSSESKPEPTPIDCITQREQCLMILAESTALPLLVRSINNSLAIGIDPNTIRTALLDAVDTLVRNTCVDLNATPPTPRSTR